MTESPFDRFQQALSGPDILERLRDGLIGKGTLVPGPFGPKPMIYCDYTASGRALRQIEEFVMEEVLPFYANSHTEASYCGARMTVMRREARALIGRACGAGPEHAVIFCGSGATAGLNRLVHLFGIPKALADGVQPVVLSGPYEHHSNILPWRESGAEVITVPEADDGGPCMEALEDAIATAGDRPLIGAFSAASNVTGRRTHIAAVTRRLKAAGARVVWDYAAGGPYMPIAMTPGDGAEIDAIVVSPHKFVGGPGTTGVLVIRRDAVATDRPTWAGGGTVRFVSPTSHDYIDALEAREEAGTPNVVGDIRAALVFAVKQAVGSERIMARGAELRDRALAVWRKEPRIEILGTPAPDSLAIVSFRVRDGAGALVHHQFVTRLLSDLHGVQVRGGCACAGPYVHSLLGIGPEESERLRSAILAGREAEKPGFVRLNFSYLMSDADAEAVIGAVLDVAARAAEMVAHYEIDADHAIFRARSRADAA